MLNDPVNKVDPLGLLTISVGVYANAALGVGGGGGMELSLGYSKKSGFSIALAGTAQGGAIAGAGAFVGGGITITDACDVNQLNGTSYQAGRAGLGPLALEGIKGNNYSGGTLYGGYGTGATANSLTASTTSSLFQYDNGNWSMGNTGSDSIWSQK